MIIEYIGLDWNKKLTDDVVNTPSYLEQKGKIWFEKREIPVPVVEKKEKKEVEVESEVVVQEEEKIDEIEQEIDEEIAGRMKEFLKEKKVRGYGLLKGEGLKKRAIEEGFIIN